MSNLGRLYRDSLALLTDLYQLTMAYGYWKSGLAERGAVYHQFFRKNPFGGGYVVACGHELLAEWLENLRFAEDDLQYLAGLQGNDGRPMFEQGFLDHLRELRFSCDVDAVPEGTVMFPYEPLVRVRGPLLQCQLLETPLLTLVNFPTLIATKAARVCREAQGDAVIEFGLRRAQGIDGGVSAARAAYVGGCVGTSNVLAGKLYGMPVLGTHAHSWVMAFDDERQSFHAWADAMPNNSIFLVDTYRTVDGVHNAVDAGRRLRERGYEMVGIRLDSGDLGSLSVESRKILDEGGFPEAKIVGSGDLDEYRIRELKQHGAKIDLWGVGTHLTTAYDEPALSGVYKLAAVEKPGEGWQPRLKLSDDPVKTTNPGIQQVRRFYRDGAMLGDVIYNEEQPPHTPCAAVDLQDHSRTRTYEGDMSSEDLLKPVFRAGRPVAESPPLSEIREYALQELDRLPDSVKRLDEPERYPVGLEGNLHQLKADLMRQAEEHLR